MEQSCVHFHDSHCHNSEEEEEDEGEYVSNS